MEGEDKQKMELLEKIDNYLSGDLAGEERRAFEGAIHADPELGKNVEMNRIVNEALKDKKLSSLQEDINKSMKLIRKISRRMEVDFEESIPDEPPKKEPVSLFSRKFMAIAASILIFIIAVFGLIKYQQSTSPDNLIAEYLEEPHKSPPFFKGVEDEAADWAINYQKGNYQEAKTALEEMVASDAANPEAEFYLGLCYLYLETPDPQNAVRQFEKVLESNNRYNEQALWYLGLAYYLSDQKELATETLKKVTGFKQKEAANLLERMDARKNSN